MPLTLLPFTPDKPRKERLHGQGVISYEQSNAMHVEQVFPQAAPDPIRQGMAPCRPARRQVAIMSNRTGDWNSGFAEDFTVGHIRIKRLQPAGRQLGVRAQNSVGVRPNISRPPAVAYGSLFSLNAPTYDII